MALANPCYISQCLSLQDCWTSTTLLQERCYWSEMLSQSASARGIHALWQYNCSKHRYGCLVTGRRYLKDQKKAKEMNGKHQYLGWVEGKKGGFYVKDKCVIILLLSLIKTWLVSKTAAVFVWNHCHKCLIICNNSSCPEHLKKKVVLESSLFVIILMIKLCTCYQCKYTTRINNHLRHMPQRWSLLKLQFGNQLFFPHSCVQTFWNSQTSNLSLLISSVF